MQHVKPTHGTDAIRVNIHDGTELKYWAEKFGVSKKDITSAVAQVGDSLTAVKQHLTPTRHA